MRVSFLFYLLPIRDVRVVEVSEDREDGRDESAVSSGD
jgi:hypothetical protein